MDAFNFIVFSFQYFLEQQPIIAVPRMITFQLANADSKKNSDW